MRSWSMLLRGLLGSWGFGWSGRGVGDGDDEFMRAVALPGDMWDIYCLGTHTADDNGPSDVCDFAVELRYPHLLHLCYHHKRGKHFVVLLMYEFKPK